MPRFGSEALPLGRSIAVGALVGTVAFMAIALAASLPPALLGPLAVVVVAAGGGLWRWLDGPPHGLTLGRQRFTWRRRGEPTRRVAYHEVTGFQLHDERIVLHTLQGDICVPREWPDALPVCRAVAARAGLPADEAAVEPLAHDEVAEWLGLAAGESLVCGADWRGLLGASGLGLLGAVGAGLSAYLLSHLPPFSEIAGIQLLVVLLAVVAGLLGAVSSAGLGLGLLILMLEKSHRGLISAEADAYGVRVGPRRVDWSDLLAVEHDIGPRWRIVGGDGEINLNANWRHAGRVLDVCRRLIAEQEQGHRLPRLGDVPPGAISRVAAPEVSAGAISRAEPDHH